MAEGTNGANGNAMPLVAGGLGVAIAAAATHGCFSIWDSMAGAVLLVLLVGQWAAVPKGLMNEVLYSLALAVSLVLAIGVLADNWQFLGQCAGQNPGRDLTFLVLWADFTGLFALLRWFTHKVRRKP